MPDILKPLKYTVISYTSEFIVIDKVNERITKGWSLFGSMKVTTSGNSVVYSQAMVFI